MCVLLHGFLEEMKCCEFCLNMGVFVCGGGRGGEVCVYVRVCVPVSLYSCVCVRVRLRFQIYARVAS